MKNVPPAEPDWAVSTTRWLCPRCEREWCVGFAELTRHMARCSGPIIAVGIKLPEGT